MIQYSKQIYRPCSERLPDDIVFYIAKFVGNQNNVSMRFINKHMYSVLKKHIPTRINYTKDFISSVEFYNWALHNLGIHEANRELILEFGCLEILIQNKERLLADSLWNAYDFSIAARGGNMMILKWLRDQNPHCPWDEWACA